MPFLMKNQLINQLNLLKIVPKKSEGQNYLIDLQICQVFVNDADILQNKEDVLEIGPGLGAFSDLLASRAHNLVLIEKDKESASFLEHHFRAHYSTQRIETRQIKYLGFIPIKNKVTVVEGDILDLPLPKVDVIIANLSFQISIEILIHLIKTWQYQRVLFILQKEFVEHLIAKAGHSHYTLISVIAGFYFNVEILRELPTNAFYPEPEVNLMVVKFTPQFRLCPGTPEFDQRIEFITFLRQIMPLKNKPIINAIKAFLKKGEIDSDHILKITQKILNKYPEWNIHPLKTLNPLEFYSLMQEIQTIKSN